MSMLPQDLVDSILTKTDDPSVIAGEFFRVMKERNPRFSYTVLGKLSGINSRGYISDVLRGHRRLRPKYADGFCQAFGLSTFSSKVFQAIVELSDEKLPNKRAHLEKQLMAMRQLMSARQARIKPMVGREFFELEMLSAFGLFGGKATAQQMTGYYEDRDPNYIAACLERLCEDNFLRKEGHVYVIVESFVSFVGSEDGRTHLDYISYILDDTKDWALRSFDSKGHYLFESFVISAKKKEVEEYATEVREKFYQWVAGLNTDEGDELVRFSVHLHPLR